MLVNRNPAHLRVNVSFFLVSICLDYLFMDDNTQLHGAEIAFKFFEEKIHRMDWPSKSPYLNISEQIWNSLGRAISQRNAPARLLQGLKDVLWGEWVLSPQTFIETLLNSMAARREAFITVPGCL
ncbi:DDE_3 domain-containing protein [Trichonephila clavipes]|nr:DDE_3 domain-containing protein [Trichonephila clavipes]